jgi:predicted flap endonuclease-1-like 5' DNA nuclease
MKSVLPEILPWMLASLIVGFLLGLFYWWCRLWLASSRISESEVSALRAEASTHETRANEVATKLDAMSAELARAKRAAADLATLRDRIGELEIATSHVEALNAQIAQLQSATAEIPALHATIAHLERENAGPATADEGPDLDIESAAATLGRRITMDDLTVVEGIGPKIADILGAGGISTWRDLAATDHRDITTLLGAAGPSFQIHDPGTWPEQACLLAFGRWEEFARLTRELDGGVRRNPLAGRDDSDVAADARRPDTDDRIHRRERDAGGQVHRGRGEERPQVRVPPPEEPDTGAPTSPDLSAGAAALGIELVADDLKVIEGIGPAIERLLQEAGIATWRRLADTTPEAVRRILEAAGPRFRIHDPGTWPAQARLLSEGRWEDFKAMTDKLKGGRHA